MREGSKASTHFAALLRIIAQFNGDVAEAERDIQRWNRGSVWIDLSPEQCSELGILLAEKRA